MYRSRTGRGGKVWVGLHGWSGNHRTFQPLWDKLPEAVSFVALDLPGCGKSAEPKSWEIRVVAQEIAQEVLSLDKEKVTLVGSCTGGLMALFVARELIEMGKEDVIGRIVMLDPFARCPWYFGIFLVPLVGPMMYATAFANPLGRWTLDMRLREKRTGKVSLTESFREVNHGVALAYLRMFAQAGEPEQFRALGVPVEIIRGEKTFAAVIKSVEEWRAIWPEVRVHVLPGVGHLPIEEGSEAVREILFRGAGERKTPKKERLSSHKARELREWRNELTRGDSVER